MSARRHVQKILLPTDGSDFAFAAAERAVALAKLAGSALQAVFVLEPFPYKRIGATNNAGVQEYQADAQRRATAAFDRISALAQASGVTLHAEIAEGSSPAEQIVETARRCGADLIVMKIPRSHRRRARCPGQRGRQGADVLTGAGDDHQVARPPSGAMEIHSI